MKPFHFLVSCQIIVLCIPLYTKFPHSPLHRWLHFLLLVLWYALSFYCYELVLLGLRIDSTITWNWLYVFIPFYIDEFLFSCNILYIKLIQLRRHFQKKDERAIIGKEIADIKKDSYAKRNPKQHMWRKIASMYSD